jgi:protein-S-isoprenylcysteine O-methyltransferase Ste14
MPPIIFIGFYAIGYISDRAFPIDFGTAVARYAAAGTMLVCSAALVIWAIACFVRAKTHVDVRKPATSLVTDGPYRLSRNPIYLAMVLFYAGFAVVFSLSITLALLIPCIALLHHGVVSREEAYLDRTFGQSYRDYKAKVRRWL